MAGDLQSDASELPGEANSKNSGRDAAETSGRIEAQWKRLGEGKRVSEYSSEDKDNVKNERRLRKDWKTDTSGYAERRVRVTNGRSDETTRSSTESWEILSKEKQIQVIETLEAYGLFNDEKTIQRNPIISNIFKFQ